MNKRKDLTARNFPSAQQEAKAVSPRAQYDGPESAYRLAFTDTEFLLREELRPVRMQLEILKPDLVQAEQGIVSTIVIYGSARILAADVATVTNITRIDAHTLDTDEDEDRQQHRVAHLTRQRRDA